MFCDACGTRLTAPDLAEIGVAPEGQAVAVRDATAIADRRTEYEAAVSWIKGFRRERGGATMPTCFLSYAWGDPHHERWIEDLGDHLLQADITVILDRWHNTPGTSISDFIKRINECDFVCAIGTPLYMAKERAVNSDPVAQAEVQLIQDRWMKRRAVPETVLPLIREGAPETSLPSLLRGSVFIDFRNDTNFSLGLFDLVLTIHRIPFDEPMARQNRAVIQGSRMH